MKILQVNNVYNNGSTGKIVHDIHVSLQQRGDQSIVCYGRGEKVKEKNVYKVCGELYSKINNVWSRVTGLMYGGLSLSTAKLISIIKKEKPDIVHLHCINCYFVNIYRLIAFLKKQNIPTVLTLHAEFMHTANCGYALDCDRWKTGCGKCPRLKQETRSLFFDGTHRSWLKMKKAFDGFDNLMVTSVSPWLMERAKQSPILADKKHTVVYNGLDDSIFKGYEAQGLREQYAKNGEKIVFHATPNFNNDPEHIKGGYYLLQLAKAMLGKNVRFVVAGEYEKNLSVPENVTLLGRISDQTQLAKLYSMADVTLLTSKKETFSMICAESLSCGTPVVGFEAGAPEQISLKEYSAFVPWGDVEELQKALENMLDKHFDKQEIASAACVYAKSHMIDEYYKVYDRCY